MATVEVLARNWDLEIEDPTATEETFVEVGGINSFTFSSDVNNAETTTFDDLGWESHLAASRSRSLSMEGFYLVDPDTGDLDEGQELINDAGSKMGQDSLIKFQLTDPGGNTKEFEATVNLADQGGGNDDPTSWGAELDVSGQPTDV